MGKINMCLQENNVCKKPIWLPNLTNYLRLFPPTRFNALGFLHLTEPNPNFELSSLPFAISVPVHDDTSIIFNIPVYRTPKWPPCS